ncbi:unnamed protein product [Bursaphelenchus okinawaensis]|uniref:Replication protein A subunit n=1 Tax=Bursaphelenchus okinawaensis TaxID=465554 RepID=A0A811LPU5_9BILA|nr:unnamed protein product [Bursaphelenchus okinawaensis]CAG9125202.1 unnamed protein product [Bursaphelenchus okinawaensis]
MSENIDTGFIQEFLDNPANAKKNPVLQLLELRITNSAPNVSFRARMSDSQFTYSSCVGAPAALEYLQKMGIASSRPVIRVNSYTTSDNNGKRLFCMVNIELIEDTTEIIGSPVAHSGNPNDYRGMNNLPVRAQSPSRKRQGSVINATTPSKRNNSSGGVFGQRIFSIKDISPYVPNFRICGLCQSKEAMRQVNTKRGPSHCLNFTIIDEGGNAIRITVWGDQASELDQIIEENQAYYVDCQGNGTVRESNKRFNSTGHPYELTLNNGCSVEVCTDRVVEPTNIKLNPISLSDIKVHPNECVDVLAAIDSVEEVSTVNAKDGRTLHKRSINLIDDTKTQVQLTLWEDDAHNFDYQVGDIIGLKGASVREFNGGFSLSVSKASIQIFPSPSSEATDELARWFQNERPNAEIARISGGEGGGSLERDFKMVGVVVGSGMAQSADDRGMYVNIKATVNSIRTENAFYESCKTCRKKVNMVDNQATCDRCGPGVESKYVYMLAMEVVDFTGATWITLFDEAAQSLLGIPANDLQQMCIDDKDAYDSVFDKIRFNEYVFRCRVKYETFNDRQNLRWTAMQVNPVNYEKFCQMFEKSLNVMNNL